MPGDLDAELNEWLNITLDRQGDVKFKGRVCPAMGQWPNKQVSIIFILYDN